MSSKPEVVVVGIKYPNKIIYAYHKYTQFHPFCTSGSGCPPGFDKLTMSSYKKKTQRAL